MDIETTQSGKPGKIRESNQASGALRHIKRSTMYEKASFC